MLTPSIGFCFAVKRIRRLNAGSFENRGHNVRDVMELTAQTAFLFDLRRPRDDNWVTSAAEMRGDLFGPLEGCVHRVRPRGGKVIVMLGATEFVDVRQHGLQRLEHSIEASDLVRIAIKAAFS